MLQAVYQSTTVASTFVDKDFKIIYCNQIAKNIAKNISRKEVQFGDLFLEYVDP